MASMYDTILGLPFFHGLDHDAVSHFVEKVPVHFGHYGEEDILFSVGQSCEGLTYILNGMVEVRLANEEAGFAISYRLPAGCVLGADFLYGIEREYPYDVRVVSVLDTLELTKEHFAWLMGKNEICAINYFNYLSRRSQRPIEGIRAMGEHSLRRCIANWVAQFTETRATDICIESTQQQLSLLTGLSVENVIVAEKQLSNIHIAIRTSQGLKILNRTALLSDN